MRQPKAESYFIIAIISLRENWRVVHGRIVLHQCSYFLAVNRDAKICAVWVSGLFCFFLKSNISLNSGIKLIVLHNLPPAHDTRHQTPDGNIIYITIIQENCLSFTAPHWTKVCFTMFTVGPSLTVTSQQTATALQRPLFLADSPYVDSCSPSLKQPLSSFPKVAVCGEVKLHHLTKGGYSCS